MIEGQATGILTIKNEYREFVREDGGLSQFERMASPQIETMTSVQVPHLRFDVILNNQFTRQLGLVLIPEATDGVDRGIDAKSPAENSLPNDVYFFLNNDRFVIEGVPFDINKRIKVGVKSAANTSFNFKLSHVINFDQNQNVFIYDGLTQTYHDIKNGNYEVVLPGGIINNRFEITFTATTLNTIVNLEESFGIFQNNDMKTLKIDNPKLIDLQNIQLFDVSGKVVFGKDKLGKESEYQFPTNGISDGVYIVKIVTKENQSLSHKIIIENSGK